MGELNLNKKDIIWSYIAQFLSIGTGILTLPFILNKLSTHEIGLNYIFLTISSVIALVDLGFAPQFARNFTYVFSGAQELKKEGIGNIGEKTNYNLLSNLLKTARLIYAILAFIAFILLLIIGTPYIYITTKGFTVIPNILYVWIVYSLGILFQIFYSYYFSMLLGQGKIKEQKYALIGNKILYITILISGLYSGWGLMSVALAQLISPFWGRYVSYHYFYTKEIQKNISIYKYDKKECIRIFRTLWHNAKRTAVMQIGAFAILRFSMFIAGLYLTLEEFASYGLMVQLVGILGSVSCTFMQISQPKFASLRTINNKTKLLSTFSGALIIYYLIFGIGSLILIFLGQDILNLIKSNAFLPPKYIVFIYCMVMFLEYNHSNFAILISSNNKIPFAPAAILTGCAVCAGIFISVNFTTLGITGLVLVQGICQGIYQNWKWPHLALKDFGISFNYLISLGYKNLKYKLYKINYGKEI